MKPMLVRTLLLALLALPVLPALAQYKVVRPDGSVTYTDRPPADVNVRVTAIGRNAAAAQAAPEVVLPLELRQLAQRYPVVLYTSADCQPCDSGRKLLQQRGIPYSERRVGSEDDAGALERLLGGRTVPALTIGAQPLRGYSEGDWTAYLDAAGYPAASKLPRNWPTPVAAPLTERAAPARTAAAPPEPRPAAEAAPVQQGGVRF
jgi:glutaredoxin